MAKKVKRSKGAIEESALKYAFKEVDLLNLEDSRTQQVLIVGANKKVLEIGPATGYVTKALRERGCQVTCIEIDSKAARIARKYANRMIRGDIENLDLTKTLKGERYDVILFGDVLEHLKDPSAVLKRLRPYLKRSGSTVATIPNVAHGSVRLLLLDGNFDPQPTGLLDSTHLHYYTRKTILELFSTSGYSVKLVKEIKAPISAAENLNLDLTKYPPELVSALESDPDATINQFAVIATPTRKTMAQHEMDQRQLVSGKLHQTLDELRTGDPLSVLLSVYYARPDLRAAYPEVRDGIYDRLVQWAAKAVETDDTSAIHLAKHAAWYRHGPISQIEHMRSELANELSALRDLKQILEESRQQIESERAALQSDTAKLQSELSARNLAGFGNADPLSTVLSLYYARLDLQRAFPEVRTGDYKELIQWASNATDDSAGRILADYIPWYRARITQLNDETTARLKVEETIKNLRQELTNQGASVQRLAEHVSQLDSEREKLQSELHARDDSITKMQSELLTRNDSIAKLQSEMFSFRGSFGFRLMRFYGPKVDRLCPEGTSRRKLKTLVSKSLRVIADEGLGSFFRKARRRIAKREFRVIEPSKLKLSTDVFYEAWIAENTLNARQLKDSIRSFLYKPKISIVMPVYNTEERFLTEAIESVRQQLYENWELCICDDGSTWPRVKKILSETCRQDKRIKVTNLSRNRGISVATNAALGLATGEFTGFLDHDDILYPDALFEVVRLLNHDPTIDYIYSDEDKIDQEGKRKDPFFKPDWSPDFILSGNYVTHFSVYRNSLLHTIGGLREGYEGSQDYDLVLRATEKTQKIRHISRVLYGWRESPRSTAGSEAVKPVAYVSAVKALQDAIVRRGTEADVEMLPIHRYRVRYAIKGKPLVTIIIPARIAKYIGKCVNSILQKTSYQNYEILVVDNSSTGFDISKTLQSSEKVRIIVDSSDYNFSRINNQAAGVARGEYLVFLNDDTEVLSEEWLSAMLEHAQREEIGAVGAKLLHANGTVQHAGIIVGINGLATNYSGMAASDPGYFALASMIRNCAAVTAACLMTRKQFFFKLGGFDESLGHSWNDVDFGIRVVQSGHRVVYTPFALLHHYVGGTRGAQDASPEEMRTRQMFREKDLEFIRRGDPFYNPNLSTELPYFPKCDLRIVSDPQALLRYVYETRQDLKDAYPEASNEDYAALYRWAASINEDTDSSWPILGRHQDWYLSQCK